MANSITRAPWPRCERCGGQMHRDPDGERTCMWCGEVRYPARPSERSGGERFPTHMPRRPSL